MYCLLRNIHQKRNNDRGNNKEQVEKMLLRWRPRYFCLLRPSHLVKCLPKGWPYGSRNSANVGTFTDIRVRWWRQTSLICEDQRLSLHPIIHSYITQNMIRKQLASRQSNFNSLKNCKEEIYINCVFYNQSSHFSIRFHSGKNVAPCLMYFFFFYKRYVPFFLTQFTT